MVLVLTTCDQPDCTQAPLQDRFKTIIHCWHQNLLNHFIVLCIVICVLSAGYTVCLHTSRIEYHPSHKIWALKMCLPQYSVNYIPSWALKEVSFLMFVFLTVAQPIGLLNQTCKTSGYFCGAFEGFTLLECYWCQFVVGYQQFGSTSVPKQ